MNLEIYTLGPYANNVYILRDYDSKQAVVIDAPPESYEKLANSLSEFKIHLFLTHGHWDHMTDASDFQKKSCALIYSNKEDQMWLESDAQRDFVPHGVNWKAVCPDVWLEDNEKICVGIFGLKIIHLPGHTQGQIGIYLPEQNFIFVGDTLFKESVGNTSWSGGNFQTLSESIRNKLYSLPKSTVVYPGHGSSTTIEHEIKHNPFVSKN